MTRTSVQSTITRVRDIAYLLSVRSAAATTGLKPRELCSTMHSPRHRGTTPAPSMSAWRMTTIPAGFPNAPSGLEHSHGIADVLDHRGRAHTWPLCLGCRAYPFKSWFACIYALTCRCTRVYMRLPRCTCAYMRLPCCMRAYMRLLVVVCVHAYTHLLLCALTRYVPSTWLGAVERCHWWAHGG